VWWGIDFLLHYLILGGKKEKVKIKIKIKIPYPTLYYVTLYV
jgi:hypothetical protein